MPVVFGDAPELVNAVLSALPWSVLSSVKLSVSGGGLLIQAEMPTRGRTVSAVERIDLAEPQGDPRQLAALAVDRLADSFVEAVV